MRSDVFFIMSMNVLVFKMRDPGNLFSSDKDTKDSKNDIFFSLALSTISFTD